MPLEFMWLPQIEPVADYNIFIQLLNIDGALVGGASLEPDIEPDTADLPTTEPDAAKA